MPDSDFTELEEQRKFCEENVLDSMPPNDG
jgi:hypothetical protein